ncbi:MAG TPA: heme o synthase [Candidatus Saccharimonadales bacterium]
MNPRVVRDYIRLAKPGVTAGNVLTALAGYFLAAAHFGFDWLEFIGMTIGMTLVIGGACALNNYLDRDIDAKMMRTKTRPSVSGGLNPIGMQLFAWLLFVVGTGVLALTTNYLTVVIGVIGFVTYVWLYGAWTKRTTVHGTAVGAVSGALPIVGGYVATANMLDIGALIVFLIIFFWQFPEFYSISIYRRKEYEAAKIPLMSVVRGVPATIELIVVYTVFYVFSTLALVAWSYVGMIYLVVMSVSGGYWIRLALKGVSAADTEAWAKRMFRFSMWMILLLCLMLSVGALIP